MQNIIYLFVPSLCRVRKWLKSILCIIDLGLILSEIHTFDWKLVLKFIWSSKVSIFWKCSSTIIIFVKSLRLNLTDSLIKISCCKRFLNSFWAQTGKWSTIEYLFIKMKQRQSDRHGGYFVIDLICIMWTEIERSTFYRWHHAFIFQEQNWNITREKMNTNPEKKLTLRVCMRVRVWGCVCVCDCLAIYWYRILMWHTMNEHTMKSKATRKIDIR